MSRGQIFLLAFFLAGITLAFGQRDAVSVFGYGNTPSDGYGLSMLSFTRGQAAFKPFTQNPYPNGLYFIGTGSALSSPNGQLLLYSGGCDVREALSNREVPGSVPFVDDYLNEAQCTESGYLDGWKSELLLPAPDSWGDSVAYVIAHQTMWPAADSTFSSRGLEIKRMARRQGQYEVTNTYVIDDKRLVSSQLTGYPVPPNLGGGWWVPLIEHNSNRWRVYQIGGHNPSLTSYALSTTGPIRRSEHIYEAQLVFSPDGKYLAVNGVDPGLTVYSFNKSNGKLNFNFHVAHTNMDNGNSLGVSFSSNSKHLYFGGTNAYDPQLYTLDVERASASTNPITHIVKLGSIGVRDLHRNWPYAFGNMWLAPDCRIYIDPEASNFNVHIIEHPNRGGEEAGLIINAVDAPTRFDVDGFIAFPNYRAKYGCDSTILPIVGSVSSAVSSQTEQSPIIIFPNPASDATVISGLRRGSQLSIYTAQGALVEELTTPTDNAALPLSLKLYPPGVYTVHELHSSTGYQRSAKFVVQN